MVLDCANGAASRVAPAAFAEAGAEVHAIHDRTDGYSINDGCGSTHLGDLQAAVVRERAHVGFAFDGDADRCLAVDATGAVVDGDQILAVLARAARDRGELARRHRRRHRDEQPRLPAGHGPARHRCRAGAGRVTGTCSR